MTLEMFLWSIPVGSLASALTLIAVQAWELTRDCAAGKAILAGASGPAREPAAEKPKPGLPTGVPIAGGAGRTEAAPAASPILANPRLCPVPIVVCARRRSAA
ncbi:MAG TPA: hypothetical protein VKH43_05140 [Thermoanaerobaculia bacterium]|nr:hypothetical protein [Thermoanaerobaculia bacterium]